MSRALRTRAEVAKECHDRVRLMLTDEGIHIDMQRFWWHHEDVELDWRTPMDTLLDQDAPLVWRSAECYAAAMRRDRKKT